MDIQEKNTVEEEFNEEIVTNKESIGKEEKMEVTEEQDNFDIDNQYQTIPIRKKEERSQNSAMNTVEELIRRIVPAKSFLYRHQQRTDKAPSYLPMDVGAPKRKKFFRLSSYEYPFLDIKSRFSRQESSNDRGYYSMKTNSRHYTAKPYKHSESKTKYKSLSTSEELNEKYADDHFYEDLCYNEVENVAARPVETRVVSVKPCIVKIQELFQSFKVPFFKRPDMIEEKKVEEVTKETNFYENSDNAANMYDSVHVNRQAGEECQTTQVSHICLFFLNILYISEKKVLVFIPVSRVVYSSGLEKHNIFGCLIIFCTNLVLTIINTQKKEMTLFGAVD